MIKKRRIEKPLTDHEKRLKSELVSIKDKLDSLKTFDRAEHVNSYCDQLEFQVLDAFESAYKHLQETEQELQKEIQVYRDKCLGVCVSRSFAQPVVNGESLSVSNHDGQSQLNALSEQIVELLNKWEDYFSRPSTVAKDIEVCSAFSELTRFSQRIRSIKTTMKNEPFQGQLMVFEPNVALFEDKDYLKKALSLQHQYKCTQG